MDINNFGVWTSYNALAGHHPVGREAGTYLAGKIGALCGDGIMWGGIVAEGSTKSIRVGGSEYVSGLVPGAILTPGIAENSALPSVRVYRIRRDFAVADLRADASRFLGKPISQLTRSDVKSVHSQYAKDWSDWPTAKGAPFYDHNQNGLRDEGDDPGLLGADMVVWFVANDLDSTVSKNFYRSPPMGIETQVTWWAFKGTMGPLGNSIFMRYELIYKGASQSTPSSTIDSMYVTKWADPDLGSEVYDYAGCDTTLNLGFVYHAERRDEEFTIKNIVPPSIGYVLLQGPAIPSTPTDEGYFDFQLREGIRNVPMTAFYAHWSGYPYGDLLRLLPMETTLRVYNCIQGYLPQGYTKSLWVDNTGKSTRFMLAGDPLLRTGWYDGQWPAGAAGERRFLMSSGPFSMTRGDTQVVLYELVGNQGGDRLKSINAMKFYARQLQQFYLNPEMLVGQSGGDAEEISIPQGYGLRQNYPNPFNPSTQIRFSIQKDANVKIAVYDLLGREIAVLVDEFQFASEATINWDGRDAAGRQVPTGVYFYRLESAHVPLTKKMVLVR